MDLIYGTEYEDFTKEVQKFCKKYSGVIITNKKDLDKNVNALAEELANLAPETMQFGLEAYEKQDSKSFDEALPYLQKQIAKCFEGKDAKEGIAAFLEKRKPKWD